MAKTVHNLKERFSYSPKSPIPLLKHHPSAALTQLHNVSPALRPLPDLLRSTLRLLFVGYNPSIRSSLTQHRFAHPTNRFWPLLNQSGILPSGTPQLKPQDDADLPDKYQIGFTELVMRPSVCVTDLKPSEVNEGARVLVEKLRGMRDVGVVCFVGRGIWDAVVKSIGSSSRNVKFEWGIQRQTWFEGTVFVLPSTSGLVRIKRDVMERLWKELGTLVNR